MTDDRHPSVATGTPPERTGRDVRREGRFRRELSTLPLAVPPAEPAIVRASDLADLPGVVRRYFEFMDVEDRPRDWSFLASWRGRLRRARSGSWVRCEAWQYNDAVDIARVSQMRLALGGILPTVVRETYLGGCGLMLGKVFDLLPLVHGSGSDFDLGELVTYLNDAVLFAPSMLLGAHVGWSHVDDDSFDVALMDRDRTVVARVFLDERGAPTNFCTEDRFVNDPCSDGHPFVRARWSTPIDGWTTVDGRPRPTRTRGVWQLRGRSFDCAEADLANARIRYNVSPRE